MREETTSPDDVRAQAADWFARLNSLPVSRETLEQFFAWRRIEGHQAAFDAVERFWNASASVGERPRIVAATAAAYASGGSAPKSVFGRRVAVSVIALSVVAAAGIGAALTMLDSGTRYETRVGQQSVVTLEDGSKIALDTDTRLEVRFSADARQVTLDRGQAYFTVAHAANRPFSVAAGDTRVVATGTQFEVHRKASLTEVTLVEGSVRVNEPNASAPIRLAPGQQLQVRDARPAQVRPVNVATATAWTKGRIVFDGVPLQDAVREINRYTSRPIRLASDQNASSPLSGSFETGDVDGFVAAATALLPLQAERQSDGSVRLTDTSSDRHK